MTDVVSSRMTESVLSCVCPCSHRDRDKLARGRVQVYFSQSSIRFRECKNVFYMYNRGCNLCSTHWFRSVSVQLSCQLVPDCAGRPCLPCPSGCDHKLEHSASSCQACRYMCVNYQPFTWAPVPTESEAPATTSSSYHVVKVLPCHPSAAVVGGTARPSQAWLLDGTHSPNQL